MNAPPPTESPIAFEIRKPMNPKSKSAIASAQALHTAICTGGGTRSTSSPGIRVSPASVIVAEAYGRQARKSTLETARTIEAVLDRLRRRGEPRRTLVRHAEDPAQGICQAAREEDADVLVVGSVGMQGRKEFLLGNVPNRVSHNAPCTVVIVNTATE